MVCLRETISWVRYLFGTNSEVYFCYLTLSCSKSRGLGRCLYIATQPEKCFSFRNFCKEVPCKSSPRCCRVLVASFLSVTRDFGMKACDLWRSHVDALIALGFPSNSPTHLNLYPGNFRCRRIVQKIKVFVYLNIGIKSFRICPETLIFPTWTPSRFTGGA